MCVKMTHITLFDQNKLVFQKLDAITNPKLVLKMPNFKIIIGSLRFNFKVVIRLAFKKILNLAVFGFNNMSGLILKLCPVFSLLFYLPYRP